MGSHPPPPDFYTLVEGATYDDLFPLDFADVMWQAFTKDKRDAITITVRRNGDRLAMRVLSVTPARRPARRS